MRQKRPGGLSDESAFEPKDDGGQDEQRSVIDGALLVAGRQTTPLFEAIDAAFDDIAPRIDRFVEDQRTPWPSCSLRALVASLGNRVLDLPLAQQAAAARITIAFVSDEVIWSRPRSPAPSSAWDPDAVQDRLQLRTVMTVARRDHDGERPSAAITGEMKLGGQPSTAASEAFLLMGDDPFFSSARLRRRRAPPAW